MLQHRHARCYPCSALALSGLLAFGAPAAGQTATAPPSRPIPSVGATSTTPVSVPTLSDERGSSGIVFRDVIGRTFGDFKRLPSRETLTWLGIGAVAALAAHPADESTSRRLAQSPPLDYTFDAGEILGGASFQFLGSTATYLTGRATGRHRVAAVGADLLRAQILTQTVTAAIKHAAQRQRPDGTSYSFPSGHSSVSFASATVLQRHYGWKTGTLAYGVATYVAISRIQEERHFLSDVAFGAAVGIAAGRTVTVGVGESRLAISPTFTRGGGGVSLSLVPR